MQRPHCPEYPVHPSAPRVCGKRRGGHKDLPAYTVLQVRVSKQSPELTPDSCLPVVRELSQGCYNGVPADDVDTRQS